ncbi:G2/mitotic-specific cyclin [Orbilia blumenaviensis]|uniref:G2/mitotic-specific cyclin n=1 Tax=Orbilia blumenaviensis TaxID=1796055 RepID=A0AAV9VPS2_9PEZI
MQAKRVTRQRAQNQDENAGIASRATRASTKSVGKALASTTAASTKASQPLNRKRVALEDVSNFNKAAQDGSLEKETKKAVKSVLTAKTGVTKTKSRTVLKEKVVEEVKPVEVKQVTKTTASRPRKRSNSARTAEVDNNENEAPVEKKPEVAAVEVKTKPTKEVAAQKPTALEKEGEVFANEPNTKRTRVVEPQRAAVIELEEDDDPLMVAEYAEEIDGYLRDMEAKSMANPEYMDHQDELQWKMRGILVDWLIEVHTRFRLLPETLYLTVNIIDRFLGLKQVGLDKLQLVGVAAMWVAAKYEEVYSPSIKNFIYVSDGGYVEDELLRAERYILTTLDYDLSYPNPMNFLRRISKADDYDIRTRTFAKYLMEVSLLDYRFLEYPGSLVAAAAMYMARKMYNRGSWNASLVHYSGYTEDEIMPVFKLMVDYLARPVKHEAFFMKYADKKFKKASIKVRSWAKSAAVHYKVDLNEPVDL